MVTGVTKKSNTPDPICKGCKGVAKLSNGYVVPGATYCAACAKKNMEGPDEDKPLTKAQRLLLAARKKQFLILSAIEKHNRLQVGTIGNLTGFTNSVVSGAVRDYTEVDLVVPSAGRVDRFYSLTAAGAERLAELKAEYGQND